MDFDSLAFRGITPSSVNVPRRDYCAACLEERIDSRTEHCFVCGEALSSRPSNQQAGTGTHTSDAGSSEQVSEEILRFIRAVERNGIPVRLGLPSPTDGDIDGGLLEDWQGAVVINDTQEDGTLAPASQGAIDNLRRFEVTENSWVLHQTTLRLERGLDTSLDALFAQFSPPPSESIISRLMLAQPTTGHVEFDNTPELHGSLVVVDRGMCTFVSKAIRAQQAGAVGVIVVQSGDVWPYVMEDSKGEAKAMGLKIPVCMIDKENGEAVKRALMSATAKGVPVRAELSVSTSEKRSTHSPHGSGKILCICVSFGSRQCVFSPTTDCIVCQDLFAVGATLFRLPCGHLYHEGCLLKWLKLRNTCPYCRLELPTSNPNKERERRQRDAGSEETWSEWFN